MIENLSALLNDFIQVSRLADLDLRRTDIEYERLPAPHQHGRPKGRTLTYVSSVRPVGYPDTAAICGLHGCERPGVIWLNDVEHRDYQRGQRVFAFNNAAMKVKAE